MSKLAEDFFEGRLNPGDDDGEFWHESSTDVFLSHWCARYDEARKTLEENGGYLLPYKRQFVVVERGFIKALGLDPDDPAWKAVGYDVARPLDSAAYQKLVQARAEKRV